MDHADFDAGMELLASVPLQFSPGATIAVLAKDHGYNHGNGFLQRLNSAALKRGIWLRYRGSGPERQIAVEPCSQKKMIHVCEAYWYKVYRE